MEAVLSQNAFYALSDEEQYVVNGGATPFGIGMGVFLCAVGIVACFIAPPAGTAIGIATAVAGLFLTIMT